MVDGGGGRGRDGRRQLAAHGVDGDVADAERRVLLVELARVDARAAGVRHDDVVGVRGALCLVGQRDEPRVRVDAEVVVLGLHAEGAAAALRQEGREVARGVDDLLPRARLGNEELPVARHGLNQLRCAPLDDDDSVVEDSVGAAVVRADVDLEGRERLGGGSELVDELAVAGEGQARDLAAEREGQRAALAGDRGHPLDDAEVLHASVSRLESVERGRGVSGWLDCALSAGAHRVEQ